MISALKKNTPFNYILMFIILLFLWTYKLYYSPTSIEPYDIFSPLFPNIPESSFFNRLQIILGFITYFFIGFILIKLNSYLFLVENGFQAPGIVFAIFSGYFLNTQKISSILIAAMLLLISIFQILKSFSYYKAYKNMFNAGFLLGISFLFYPKIIFFLPYTIVIMFMVKPIFWREPIFFFTGFFYPVIFYFSFFVLKNNLNIESTIFKFREILIFSISKVPKNYLSFQLFIFIPQLIFFLISIISKYIIYKPLKIRVRKNFSIIIFGMLYFIIFILSPLAEIESIILIYPFASVLLAYAFVNYKTKPAIIIFSLFFISVLLTQAFQIYYYLKIF